MQRLVFNSQKTGFFLGFLLPVISFFAFYLFRYTGISLSEFLTYVYFRGVLSPLLSLNILPNLILFFFFVKKDYLLSARGVLIATIIFAGAVFFFKVI